MSARPMGNFKRQTARGEGCIKRFLDTGSIPVGSTKHTKRHACRVFFAFYGVAQRSRAARSGASGSKHCVTVSLWETPPSDADFPRLYKTKGQTQDKRFIEGDFSAIADNKIFSSHFISQFKRYFGMTPLEYKRKHCSPKTKMGKFTF